MRKTTTEYSVTVDDLELRLSAPSFSTYVGERPPTPGEIAMQGRTIPREYPYVHLRLEKDVGRVDLLNMRVGMKFVVIECRAEKPFADWQQFKTWYAQDAREFYVEPQPCTAFGLEGMCSTSGPRKIQYDSTRWRESFYLLTDRGAVLGIHFSITDYVTNAPAKDYKRIDELIHEIKRGLSITRRKRVDQ